jgi:hypothetical protein
VLAAGRRVLWFPRFPVRSGTRLARPLVPNSRLNDHLWSATGAGVVVLRCCTTASPCSRTTCHHPYDRSGPRRLADAFPSASPLWRGPARSSRAGCGSDIRFGVRLTLGPAADLTGRAGHAGTCSGVSVCCCRCRPWMSARGPRSGPVRQRNPKNLTITTTASVNRAASRSSDRTGLPCTRQILHPQ